MFQFLPIIALPAIVFGLARSLQGRDLSRYDTEREVDFPVDADAHYMAEMKDFLFKNFDKAATIHGSEPPKSRRKHFESMNAGRTYPGITFTPMTIGDMSGEWVQAKTADPDRRLLYFHGGAFTIGSAQSHRPITAKLAKDTGASVCAVNYRLMPEHTRKDAITDSRRAYEYLLTNGPHGPAPMKSIAVGGDSAGGNLTLSLINWVRDQGLSPVNAAFAISPQTDSTMTTPGINENINTDHMLRPMIKPLLKMPHTLLLFLLWKATGFKPSDPQISPIRAPLNDLPPTLIHASRQEMLYYDALRYFNKSSEAGNEVKLQVWAHVPHIWHIFDNKLPQADDAMDEIIKFLNKYGF